MYTSCVKNTLYLATSAKQIRSLGKYCFLTLFDNVIKNDITNSVAHIIVCLLKTE